MEITTRMGYGFIDITVRCDGTTIEHTTFDKDKQHALGENLFSCAMECFEDVDDFLSMAAKYLHPENAEYLLNKLNDED